MPDKTTDATRVLVADSRRLVRELLAFALSQAPGVQVRSAGCDLGRLAVGLLVDPPDVILLGGDCYECPLPEAVRRVREASPRSSVLVVSADSEDEAVFAALEAGATGFVPVTSGVKELAAMVSSAADETVLPAEVASRVLSRVRVRSSRPAREGARHELTPREHEILCLLVGGLANAEIAKQVGLSTNTVRNHLYSVYRKLGVSSRGQAFVEASRRGLVR